VVVQVAPVGGAKVKLVALRERKMGVVAMMAMIEMLEMLVELREM